MSHRVALSTDGGRVVGVGDSMSETKAEGNLAQRVEELERQIKALQDRPSISRTRPANWPKLDANFEPFAGRFAGE